MSCRNIGLPPGGMIECNEVDARRQWSSLRCARWQARGRPHLADQCRYENLVVGRVVHAELSRHFLSFFIVAAIAYSPMLLIESIQTIEPIEPSEALSQALWTLLGGVLLVVLPQLGDAI